MARPDGKLGYETRSWPAALVMRASDLFPRRALPLPTVWPDRVVISCLGGLGDLVLQLPLLAALEKKARQQGSQVRVALRPSQVEIGKKLGWEIIPWENPLLVLLKKGAAGPALRQAVKQIASLRRERIPLWIDLTGHVLNAAAFKLAGVQHLAAKTSAGGRCWIDHPLPHQAYQNEYATPAAWARHLGVELDSGVYARLVPPTPRGPEIVLALSAGRWREWPLENFASLIRAQPDLPFTLVGLRSELRNHELPLLEELARLPNVKNKIDCLTSLELIATIAQARAIVTPDGAPPHIAHFYGTPGLALYGPVWSEAWRPSPSHLRLLQDTSCPLYPCHYQAGCRRPADWCMRKITPAMVQAQLTEVLKED